MNTAMRSILLLCVLWLSGCTYVHTTNPISDGNTPVDERFIGTWWAAPTDAFFVFDIQKKDKNTNELAMVWLGDGECNVVEGRTISDHHSHRTRSNTALQSCTSFLFFSLGAWVSPELSPVIAIRFDLKSFS